MKKNAHKIILVAAFALILSIGIVKGVSASPSFLLAPVTTAAATSSVSTVNPTTSVTLQFDAYATGRPYAVNSSTLFIQDTASTSASQIKVSVTYSQDGIDWYADNLTYSSIYTNTNGTSTLLANTGNSYSYALLGNTTASTTRTAVSLPTPTRYVRATFSGLVGTSSIWASIIPKQEAI